MIYKHDITKRKSFLVRLIIYYLIITVIFSGLLELLTLFLSVPQSSVFIMIGLLVAIYSFMGFRSVRTYDSVEVELTDTDLFIRYNGYEKEIPVKEIRKIAKRPSVIDSKRIVIYKKNFKGIIINSFLENFEEFKSQLLEKTGQQIKNDFAVTAINMFLYGLIFLPIVSLVSKNIPFIIISNLTGTLVCGFDIFRFIISDLKKSRKITHILIYGILGILFSFNVLSNIALYKFFDYRKTVDGVKVLMRREVSYRYDKNGNQIYITDNFNKYKYKYDDNNNQIFFHDLTDNYKEWKIYKDGLCIESHDSDGVVSKYEYDENGNQIHTSDNTGFDCVMTYDDKENLISSITNDEIYTYYEYDENNNEIYVKHISAIGHVTEVIKKYDDENRLIYNRRSQDSEQFYTYLGDSKITKRFLEGKLDSEEIEIFDDNNNCLSSKKIFYQEDDDGEVNELIFETVYVYDDHNNVRKMVSNDGIVEYSYDYDKNGNMLRSFSYKIKK